MGDYIVVTHVGYQEIRGGSSSNDCDCDGVSACAVLLGLVVLATLVVIPCVDLAYTIGAEKAGAIEGSRTYYPTGSRRMWGWSDYSNICGDLRRISVPNIYGQDRLYGGPATFCKFPSGVTDRDELCDLARKTNTNGALKLAGCIVYASAGGFALIAVVAMIFFCGCKKRDGLGVRELILIALLAMIIGAILEIVAIAGQRAVVSGYKGSAETHYTTAVFSSIDSFMLASSILKLIFTSITLCVVTAKSCKK